MLITKSKPAVVDPIKFAEKFWPDINFYRQQREIIYSVADNDETFVPAANMLGKDFIAGFIVVWFFFSRNPCRIVTTSAKDDHLRVLWAEISRFITSAKIPLDSSRGGPFIVNSREIKKVVKGVVDRSSYVVGMVASPDTQAALQGHHVDDSDGVPRNLFVGDEASSLADMYYKMCGTWARRKLIIGNTWPCENFFKRAIKGAAGTKDVGGDIKDERTGKFFRKVIKIKARETPNVRFSVSEILKGLRAPEPLLIRTEDRPWGEYSQEEYDTLLTAWNAKNTVDEDYRTIMPGILPFREYLRRRKLWSEAEQCVTLDAEFHEGVGSKLYPSKWLDRAAVIAANNKGRKLGKLRTMGVDSAAGGDNTAYSICDELGLLFLLSLKTPNTAQITGQTLALMRQYTIQPEDVLFDAGGGGKQHADRLRAQGYPVRTVAFGETVVPQIRRGGGMVGYNTKRNQREERYTYKNRRAEMYGLLRRKLDPDENEKGFGIPEEYTELRRQLEALPYQHDGEGRMFLPPKNKVNRDSKEITITDLIGCSPDESDATVLAIYGQTVRVDRPVVRAM